MLKFDKKYEFAIKFLLTVICFAIAMIYLFVITEPEKREFHVSIGVVMGLLGIFNLFNAISFYKNRENKILKTRDDLKNQ
jgi:predicted membrane channel-forming protein YqfA (hemolysin III family)